MNRPIENPTVKTHEMPVSSGDFGVLNDFNKLDSFKKVATFGRHLDFPFRFTVGNNPCNHTKYEPDNNNIVNY